MKWLEWSHLTPPVSPLAASTVERCCPQLQACRTGVYVYGLETVCSSPLQFVSIYSSIFCLYFFSFWLYFTLLNLNFPFIYIFLFFLFSNIFSHFHVSVSNFSLPPNDIQGGTRGVLSMYTPLLLREPWIQEAMTHFIDCCIPVPLRNLLVCFFFPANMLLAPSELYFLILLST